MNIKKALLVTLSTGLIATTLVNTNYVNAEEIPKSEAIIEFKESTEPVDPLNPEDPDKDFIPDEDMDFIIGENGPLSLNYISLIDFGNPEINVEDHFYKSETEFPNVQVSDHRGHGYGWHVTAEISNFTDLETETDEPSLPGSYITLKNGEAISKKENTSKEPKVTSPILLRVGEPEQLITESKGRIDEKPQGLGDWVIRWISEGTDKNENVTLFVPAGVATKGSHTADINWTLIDGPVLDNTHTN